VRGFPWLVALAVPRAASDVFETDAEVGQLVGVDFSADRSSAPPPTVTWPTPFDPGRAFAGVWCAARTSGLVVDLGGDGEIMIGGVGGVDLAIGCGFAGEVGGELCLRRVDGAWTSRALLDVTAEVKLHREEVEPQAAGLSSAR